MSENCLPEEAENLKFEIFDAIERLEQLGSGVIEDLVLCRDISHIRGTTEKAFADIARQENLLVIDRMLDEIFYEVTGLQDRVIASMKETVHSLKSEAAFNGTTILLH